MIIINI